MTRGKEVQDFIKDNRLTAKEMFENNGFTQSFIKNEFQNFLVYKNENLNTIVYIDLDCELYQVSRYKNSSHQSQWIDGKLNRLIQYQLRELRCS